MAIKLFSEKYLSYVAENLGTMLEHAVNNGLNYVVFWNAFVNSNVAKQIEKGNPKYLSCSAIDYLKEIAMSKEISLTQNITKNRYYWAGWILTQWQYTSGYSFYKIEQNLPVKRVLELYPTLHEADEKKFFAVASTYFNKNEITNLKKIRQASGFSQKELARRAEVDLRSIQMYEQRRNNINKAQAETLLKLATVFGCEIEDLLE